jgi:dihydroxyacetone kinase-like predicted kinase
VSDPSIVRVRAVVEAGLAALEARREEVNDLNVFPVADGDTGDNMVLTLRAPPKGARSTRSAARRSSRRSRAPRCSAHAATPA